MILHYTKLLLWLKTLHSISYGTLSHQIIYFPLRHHLCSSLWHLVVILICIRASLLVTFLWARSWLLLTICGSPGIASCCLKISLTKPLDRQFDGQLLSLAPVQLDLPLRAFWGRPIAQVLDIILLSVSKISGNTGCLDSVLISSTKLYFLTPRTQPRLHHLCILIICLHRSLHLANRLLISLTAHKLHIAEALL